jgi:hypothetical protein
VALPTQMHSIDAGTEMIGGSCRWRDAKPAQEFAEFEPFGTAVRRVAEQCEIRDPKRRGERIRRTRMDFLRQFGTQWMILWQSESLLTLRNGAHRCTVQQKEVG